MNNKFFLLFLRFLVQFSISRTQLAMLYAKLNRIVLLFSNFKALELLGLG